ncbi:MAG: hypothetical protein AB3N18_09740 [Allomuricauda sp.]
MKRIVISATVLAMLFIGCSKDDGSKCESCTSDQGIKFEICDNGDGTYSTRAGDIMGTLPEEELQEILEFEGLTIKGLVQQACADDGQEE